MNLMKIFVLPLILLGSLYIQTSHAETELFGAPSDTTPVASPENIAKPVNGMSMNAVIQDFGEPENRMSPVGDPPITRWLYNQFTVYFERNLVIHSVTNR